MIVHLRRVKWSILLPGLLLAFLAGCSLDYQDAMIRETLDESIPDLVLENLEHVMVKDGEVVARLQAAHAVQYDKRNLTELEGVYFTEFDRKGELLTEAWADKAVWHRDTEDAEAFGDIYLYSHKQDAELLAQSLAWDKQERVLAAAPGDRVLMRRDDGSELEGTGFRADFRRSDIRLDAARGVYVYGEEADSEGDAATGPQGPEPGEADAGSL